MSRRFSKGEHIHVAGFYNMVQIFDHMNDVLWEETLV